MLQPIVLLRYSLERQSTVNNSGLSRQRPAESGEKTSGSNVRNLKNGSQMGVKGRRKARAGGFWARVGPSVTAGSCLSLLVHGDAYARTGMYVCTSVLAGLI